MLRSPKALIPEEQYVRTRDDPFFNGLLRGGYDARRKRSPILDQLQKNSGSRDMSRSVSDIGDIRRKTMVPDLSETPTESPADIGFQPTGKISKTASFPLSGSHIDLAFVPVDELDVTEQPSPRNSADNSIVFCSPDPARPAIEKSYSLRNGKLEDLPSISFPLSAATFYNGVSPRVEIVVSCESTMKLNVYLNARRDDINAGVPGKFLHAVVGQDSPTLDPLLPQLCMPFT